MTDLPRHLDRETVEELAEECETMFEFTHEARVGRHDGHEILKHFGVRDKIRKVRIEDVEGAVD